MGRSHNYFVYIIECSDGSYYTGITNDVEHRVWEHNEEIHRDSLTFKRRPVKLKYCQKFVDIKQAISREKQVRGWSRKKKEALFIEDWTKIIELSKSKGNQSSTNSD